MSASESDEDLSPPQAEAEAEDAGLAAPEGWRHAFSALRNPNYRHFYSGQSVSLIGTWARTAALGWIAFQFTRSEFLLGIVFMLNSLPIFLFALYAGALADRVPKIRIFTCTSWFALVSSLVLGLLLFRGPVPIGCLMLFAFFWGLAMAFEMPARQTLMVELVGKKDLVNAIALNSAMVNASRVIGPAIGGFLLAAVGPAWCFLLDAVSYLAVLNAIRKIRLPPSHYVSKTGKGGWRYTLEGFKFVKTNAAIAQAVAMLFVVGLGGWAYRSQLSAFAVTQLKTGAQGYGWLLAFNGLGACVAALFIAARGSRLVRVHALYTGAAVFAVFIVLAGFIHRLAAGAFLFFFVGAGITLLFSIGNSLIQTQSPDHLRGRLMGIWAMVFGASMPIGSFWMGIAAQHLGSGRALQVGGLFCAVGSAFVYLLCRSTPKRS